MPTVQGTDAFDHGFDVPADYDAVDDTPTAVTTPLYQTRLNSLEIAGAGGGAIGVTKNITGTPTRGWTGFPLRIPSAPTGGGLRLAELVTAASDRHQLRLTGTGALVASSIGGTSGSTVAISFGTFYWIELLADVSTGTHALYWRLNGVDQSGSTKTVAASTVASAKLGVDTTEGTLTWHVGGYWAWGSAAFDTDWLGEPSPPSDTFGTYETHRAGRGAGW